MDALCSGCRVKGATLEKLGKLGDTPGLRGEARSNCAETGEAPRHPGAPGQVIVIDRYLSRR